VEAAFARLATGGVIMPPILSMAIEEHHGEVDVKTAYVPGLDYFAIKVSPPSSWSGPAIRTVPPPTPPASAGSSAFRPAPFPRPRT